MSGSSIGNSSRDAKKRQHDSMMWWGCVVLWYSSAMVTITTSKIILTRMSFPYVVCYFQFGIAALCGKLLSVLPRVCGRNPNPSFSFFLSSPSFL